VRCWEGWLDHPPGMRKTPIALVLALLPGIAAAQVYLPPGVGLPPQSVIGNALPQAGDAVAVSFAQLRSSLSIPAVKTCASHQWFNTLTSAGLGCSQPALSDISGFGALVTTFLATPTSGNLRAILPDETGTGGAVFAIGPALVNPNLGTPSAAILTNATGLPISSGVSGLGTGVAAGLGVNVGSPGAFYVVGGALGTPSSGVATNLTGTAAGLTAGTVTTNANLTGAVTSVGNAASLGSFTSANLRTALTDESGTGPAYFQGGDLGTPSAGVATNITALNATQLTTGIIPAARTNGHQNGTATNDNAAAGEVGEYQESVLASGSATSLSTGTAKTIVNLSLTAGDWDVACSVSFLPAASTSITQLAASISLTTNTNDFTVGRGSTISTAAQVPGVSTTALPTMPVRMSFAGTTSVFCVGFGAFTVSTMTAYGFIKARRVR